MIALGCDHGGYELKEYIKAYLESKGVAVKDMGTHSTDSVNYPDYAKLVCNEIQKGACDSGILFCGTGIGISIAANKFDGIRCAHCTEPLSAALAKEHNNANVIALGGRVTGCELAAAIVDAWMRAEFLGGRHQTRIDIIHSFEK